MSETNTNLDVAAVASSVVLQEVRRAQTYLSLGCTSGDGVQKALRVALESEANLDCFWALGLSKMFRRMVKHAPTAVVFDSSALQANYHRLGEALEVAKAYGHMMVYVMTFLVHYEQAGACHMALKGKFPGVLWDAKEVATIPGLNYDAPSEDTVALVAHSLLPHHRVIVVVADPVSRSHPSLAGLEVYEVNGSVHDFAHNRLRPIHHYWPRNEGHCGLASSCLTETARIVFPSYSSHVQKTADGFLASVLQGGVIGKGEGYTERLAKTDALSHIPAIAAVIREEPAGTRLPTREKVKNAIQDFCASRHLPLPTYTTCPGAAGAFVSQVTVVTVGVFQSEPCGTKVEAEKDAACKVAAFLLHQGVVFKSVFY
jgi:hypothetical protein